jgi:lipopolysaccharide export LptBFGC system permease protein LptF
MENSPEYQEKLELLEDSLKNLNETRKWTTFLAILGFVFLGFLVLMALAMGAFMSGPLAKEFGPGFGSGFPGILIALVYLGMAILYFFPILYLYRFSTQTRNAIEHRDSNILNQAFYNLRSHYKFIGILAIIMLAMYVLSFIFILLGGAFFGIMNGFG